MQGWAGGSARCWRGRNLFRNGDPGTNCFAMATLAITLLTAATATAASPTWLMPANGVPMSGAESEATCEAIGQRLCTYDELCPLGSGSPALDMPPDHTDWMPYKDTVSESRRWIHGGCVIHEMSYGPNCHTPGCDTTMCSTECCSHGWCTKPGFDECASKMVEANGFSGSCKGTFACCGADEAYTMSPSPLSFDEAVSYCASQGRVLASPRNGIENHAVYKACLSQYACWLNAKENAAGTGWVHGSGNPLLYSNWDAKSGEGECHCGEDRVFIKTVHGDKWHDVNQEGDGKTHALCQSSSLGATNSTINAKMHDAADAADWSKCYDDSACTSPGLWGTQDCWAGSHHEPCTCSRGKAKPTGVTSEHEVQQHPKMPLTHAIGRVFPAGGRHSAAMAQPPFAPATPRDRAIRTTSTSAVRTAAVRVSAATTIPNRG